MPSVREASLVQAAADIGSEPVTPQRSAAREALREAASIIGNFDEGTMTEPACKLDHTDPGTVPVFLCRACQASVPDGNLTAKKPHEKKLKRSEGKKT